MASGLSWASLIFNALNPRIEDSSLIVPLSLKTAFDFI